jgi:EmrB/QacA subfamily drug resistance transporter
MDASESKKPALIVATVASFITPFMVSSVTVALPTIGREFSMSAVALGWVATSYILASAVSLVPFGKIADIHGRKRVFLWGISLYTLTSLLCAAAPATWFLIALRVCQGVSASMIFGTGIAIVTSLFAPGERGRALGIITAATYLGLSVGPTLGGLLTEHLGWRSLFFTSVPIGVFVVIYGALKLKGEWAEARGERFDTPGAAIFGVSLAAVMYGFSALPAGTGAWLLGAGALGIISFVLWESRAVSPLLRLDLFRGNRVFTFSNLAALINYSASFSVTFLMSLYLQYIKALTPQTAGIVLVFQPIVMAVFSPFAGRLSDRIESRIVASTGMALLAVALFVFIFLGPGTPLGVIIGNLMLLGFGFALFSAPNTNAVMSSVEPRSYGVASATLATMRMVGQMLSMGIAMLMFALYIGKAPITPASYPPFLTAVRVAFIISTVLSVVGVFASLARGDVRGKWASVRMGE